MVQLEQPVHNLGKKEMERLTRVRRYHVRRKLKSNPNKPHKEPTLLYTTKFD